MSNTIKILIAEDEKPLAHAMEMKLKSAGYDVVVAANGQAAKEQLSAGGFNLVLLDLVMPVSDGFSVLGEMQKNGDKTPVLVMSNLSQDEDEKRATQLGAKGFLIKSNNSLSEIVKKVQDLTQ